MNHAKRTCVIIVSSVAYSGFKVFFHIISTT